MARTESLRSSVMGPPEHGSRIGCHAQVGLSIELNIDRRNKGGSAVHLVEQWNQNRSGGKCRNSSVRIHPDTSCRPPNQRSKHASALSRTGRTLTRRRTGPLVLVAPFYNCLCCDKATMASTLLGSRCSLGFCPWPPGSARR